MKRYKQAAGAIWFGVWLIVFTAAKCICIVQAGQEELDIQELDTQELDMQELDTQEPDMQEMDSQEMDSKKEAQDLLSELGLSDIDAYLQQEDLGQMTFSQLVQELMSHGLTVGFASVGEKIKQAVFADYRETYSKKQQTLPTKRTRSR